MSISYELAKKLKDSGFPWKEREINGVSVCDCSPLPISGGKVYHQLNPEPFTQCAWKPTLSDLIEACGDEFGGLNRIIKGDGGDTFPFKPYWFTRRMGSVDWEEVCGSTPEEAVAWLWIDLYKGKMTQ